MRDRTPTKVLENGALRYGVYDETGKFLRHEYLVLEDEPTDVGTDLDKANLLKDTTAALYGLGTEAVPDDVLAAIKTLIENLDNSKAMVQTGNYTGAGLYGEDTPNVLTFEFEPKIVFIYGWTNYKNEAFGFAFETNPALRVLYNYNNLGLKTAGGSMSISGKTLSWYVNGQSENAAETTLVQLNSSGTTYAYVAIG